MRQVHKAIICYLQNFLYRLHIWQSFFDSVPLRNWGRVAMYLNIVACESNYIDFPLHSLSPPCDVTDASHQFVTFANAAHIQLSLGMLQEKTTRKRLESVFFGNREATAPCSLKNSFSKQLRWIYISSTIDWGWLVLAKQDWFISPTR